MSWLFNSSTRHQSDLSDDAYSRTLMGQQERLNRHLRALGRAAWLPLERALWRLLRRV
jgi:hypothetical protein